MVTVTRKKFEKLLKDNGFLKHKKYYFRLLNKNVFQTIGFVYKGGLWHLTFFSDIFTPSTVAISRVTLVKIKTTGVKIHPKNLIKGAKRNATPSGCRVPIVLGVISPKISKRIVTITVA